MNTWGQQLRLSIFGESHGPGIGMVLDGVEPGTVIDGQYLKFQMARRAPGGALATSRKEADEVEFVSGVLEGKTCASPICALIRNTNTRSQDYASLATWMRPSHADYPAYIKYEGHSDIRGGGHFSGRLTAPLVAAGTICEAGLRRHMDLTVGSHITKLYTYEEPAWDIPEAEVLKQREKEAIPCLFPEAVQSVIEEAKKDSDSVGGTIQTGVIGVPAGLGDPFFWSLESRISSLLFSVPAVKGVLFGAGSDFPAMRGSQANDAYYKGEGSVKTRTNHNGGILGGITSGMPLTVTTVLKPTASIGIPQESVNLMTGEDEVGQVQGRHDPCIVLRAVPVVEAVIKIALYDAWLEEYGRK